LHQERPYLRPVIFVPSVYTRILFQEEEEILQPVVEEVGASFLHPFLAFSPQLTASNA
jgi:hypothetical protein